LDYSALSVEKRLEAMKDFFESDLYKTETARITANMSRAERRESSRKGEKLRKCVKSLTPIQLDLIEQIADMKTDEKISEFRDTLDRTITATLISALPDENWDYIDNLIDRLSEYVNEDVSKLLELKKECKGDQKIMNKTMQKYEDEIKVRVEKLLEQGVSQKEAIETLVIEFPKLSKSMITNAYKKLKSEYEKAHQEEEDPDTKEAVDAIMEILDEKEEPVDKIIEEAEKYVEEAEKSKGLKVLEEKVVKSIKVQGENGLYEAETGKGVILTRENASICFKNEEQLNEWIDEYRSVFAMLK
jgi:hypothetical protein